MARKPAPAKRSTTTTDKPRRDLYTEITNRIIAELEAGVAPWARPWGKANTGAIALPHNASSRRAYSGVNVLILWGEAQAKGYSSAGWLTFNQARDVGGNVRKGEKGTLIVYSDRFIPKAEAAKGDDARPVWFLKSFVVFNLDQIEGCDHLRSAAAPMTEREQHEAAESLIAATGVRFQIGGDKAFYAPALDMIQMPPQIAFHDQINYYRTAFHELGHATGAKHRLDRKLLNAFGTKDYAREELVAEMCAAFTCASLGIQPTVRHADYIGSWLAVLKEDNRAIFRAASQASKAADWIMSHHQEEVAQAA